MNEFASAIYSGKVRHRRFSPKQHNFEYNVFMMYLDLSEIDIIFSKSTLWSTKHFAPVQFKRSDFHTQQNNSNCEDISSIDASIRTTVMQQLGLTITGPIRMLVNLRYWGINMNPLSTYYCFANDGTTLVAILAEVHNTPWGERHAYALPVDNRSQKQYLDFSKKLHVSPFNPIDMQYQWHSTTPNNHLAIHLENWQHTIKIMDATMTLTREEITSKNMRSIIIRFPLMTVKIISAIYWQALKLWLKGVPIFNHPKNNKAITTMLSNTEEVNKS
jgi:uncharacterized protein